MSLKRSYTTTLSKLLQGVCQVPAALDTTVRGLSIDSRKVKKGDVFLALSGIKSAATDHIKEAIEKGAVAVIAEGSLHEGKVFEDDNVIELFVDDLSSQAGVIADRFYQKPSAELVIVGVTGTNGKTSVANYLAMYASAGGQKSASIGTLGYGIFDSEGSSPIDTGHTTPNVVQTHEILAGFRDQGVHFVAMEVSSHGLIQGRVEGVRFTGAVFTNLSHEHLDYHGTTDNYAEAKRLLFECESLKFAVANADDSYGLSMLRATSLQCDKLSYGICATSDIGILSYDYSVEGIRATAKSPIGQIAINSQLIGGFNLSNLLAVISTAIALNDARDMETRLQKIRPVRGRMEVVSVPGMPTAVVDYAHTPDALESVLEAVKPYCRGSLNLVFGCGGDRDKEKRKVMAEIAEKAADLILITDDNPRNEDPQAIVSDILSGFSPEKVVNVEHNRRKAIQRAFAQAREGDLILVAGKGHETWQEVEGVRSYFSDIEEVRNALSNKEVEEVSP